MSFWNRHETALTPSERARRLHSAWLTRALAADSEQYPRIPARRVEQGGFAAILRTATGKRWAVEWWRRILEKLD